MAENDKSRDEGALGLLTQEEAVRLLRLDCLGLSNPKETLRYLRRTRQLGYTHVAGKILIPMGEVVAYLERQSVKARRSLHRANTLTLSVAPDGISDRGDPEPRKGG